MEYFETLLEQMAFEPSCKRLPAFEQKQGRQVPTQDVALLRGHRCAGWKVQIRIFFSRINRLICKRILLNHSCAHGGVRKGVDQDETTRRSIAGIGIKEERHVC